MVYYCSNRWSWLIRCTRPSDVTQTPNGSPSLSTSTENAADSPQPVSSALNPIQNEEPKYLFSRGNQPLLYHQIGNISFFIFHYKSVKTLFCVDEIKYEHLVILSNLKSCQFAPKIVIFNLCICCQFEDSHIISPKIIPMSHHNI